MGLAIPWCCSHFFGVPEGVESPLQAALCANLAVMIFSLGLTRRLRRGRWGCRPEEGSTFFRSERKYQRKPAARHSGKKAFIAHFGGGARNVARNGVGQLSPAFGARSCSPFSAVKMGGPFSLRCLSPLCSATAGVGRSHIATVEMLWCNWKVPQHQRAELFHN